MAVLGCTEVEKLNLVISAVLKKYIKRNFYPKPCKGNVPCDWVKKTFRKYLRPVDLCIAPRELIPLATEVFMF